MRTVVFLALAAAAASACLVPRGIDDGTPGALDSSNFAPPLLGGMTFGAAIPNLIGILGTYETPIQFRLIQMANLAIYSQAASFHPTALDHFARVAESNARRRCAGSPHFELHKSVTLAYTFTFLSRELFHQDLDAFMTGLGIDVTKCTGGCGSADVDTPWGLAYTLVQDAAYFAARDGWNADGSLSSQFNRVPYKDFRGKDAYKVGRSIHNWVPLEEHNSQGFLFNQQHVVPHAGDTGRGIFLSDADHCSRTAPNPDYKYADEVNLVLQRTAQLNDFRKAEVEFFDSKLTSIVPLMVQYFVRLGEKLDDWRFIQADSMIITTLYETVMLVWREKVKYNLVRPTTLVHRTLDDEEITSYAGPFQGTQTFKANEWQPYIRIMPHAEYPSGSSCVCGAFREAMVRLLGSDDVTATLGGPLAQNFPAGSSRLEPGATPASDVLLLYTSWSQIAGDCGQSRLNGGMHFSASVPEGDALCASVGSQVAEAFLDLEQGNAPPYVVDFFNPNPTIKPHRCD